MDISPSTKSHSFTAALVAEGGGRDISIAIWVGYSDAPGSHATMHAAMQTHLAEDPTEVNAAFVQALTGATIVRLSVSAVGSARQWALQAAVTLVAQHLDSWRPALVYFNTTAAAKHAVELFAAEGVACAAVDACRDEQPTAPPHYVPAPYPRRSYPVGQLSAHQ